MLGEGSVVVPVLKLRKYNEIPGSVRGCPWISLLVCKGMTQSLLRFINPGKYNEIPGVCSEMFLDIWSAERSLSVGVQVGASDAFWVC